MAQARTTREHLPPAQGVAEPCIGWRVKAATYMSRREIMKSTLLAAAAALAIALPAGAAAAQDATATTTATTTANAAAPVLTAEQRTAYDGWPADRRTAYDGWTGELQTYFWTLTPEQQSGWWVLSDEQRGAVYAMTPEQRTTAWASIASQMSGQAPAASTEPAPAPSGTGMPAPPPPPPAAAPSALGAASPGGMQFVRKETAQAAPAGADPAALASGELPVCKKGQQDGCINSWEKNRTGTRPLNKWPGQPASEMTGAKPQN